MADPGCLAAGVGLLDVPLRTEGIKQLADDLERSEYVVRVEWERAEPLSEAYWETGLFSRRGSTAIELRDPETARKVCAHFGLEVEEPRPETTA